MEHDANQSSASTSEAQTILLTDLVPHYMQVRYGMEGAILHYSEMLNFMITHLIYHTRCGDIDAILPELKDHALVMYNLNSALVRISQKAKGYEEAEPSWDK